MNISTVYITMIGFILFYGNIKIQKKNNKEIK